MKKASTLFLRVVVCLVGLGSIALLLWFPHTEGVNASATSLREIYFDDPFLVYVYLGSVAYFVALYQAFRLLGHVDRGEVFSRASVRALRAIKYCAVAVAAFLAGAEAFIVTVQRRVEEDIAGGVMMGLVMIFVAAVVATAAAVFERAVRAAVELKSENDLTV